MLATSYFGCEKHMFEKIRTYIKRKEKKIKDRWHSILKGNMYVEYQSLKDVNTEDNVILRGGSTVTSPVKEL